MKNSLLDTIYDVAIIGAGPTGLSAAIRLKESGLRQVIVLEREPEAGGIPRHCGHPPFGIREYFRVLNGPAYAKRLVKNALQSGVVIALKTSVTALNPRGYLDIVSPEGTGQLHAKRVLLATGTRETPRSARLISGNRPLGICNTGTLQSMVYLKKMIPFRSPVVVGTEIVSFSALLTCKKAGIKPVEIIEENQKPSVAWPLHYAARLFGIPLHLNTRVVNIMGKDRVEAIQVIDQKENSRTIECDGILFTGQFTPESSLARMSHLQLEQQTGIPVTNQLCRCSDPVYYAAGNLVNNPVKVAGKCWQKGRIVAESIIQDLAEE